MKAYYNEIDRFCCDWLSNLMDAELITPGKIDDRSIVDVRPDDLAGFERVHFFAGIGGWDHSLNLAGWAGPVWTGSCPCQPFSLAGAQKGFSDERHLWPVFRELIAQRRPATVFGEQVASATEWLGLVRSDLEKMGYAVGALPIQAASAGADHLRDRYWFVADGQGERSWAGLCESRSIKNGDGITGGSGALDMAHRRPQRGSSGLPGSITGNEGDAGILDHGGRESGMAHSYQLVASEGRQQRSGQLGGAGSDQEPCDWVIGADGKARRVKPGVRLLAHGIPNRVGLLRGFGNAIDPRPAAAFIEAFMTHSQTPQESDNG
jgi:DNA (cytosine-5)-methyltransferase 1